MPSTTTWHPRGITWTYSGTLTGNELLNANFGIFGDARFDDMRYQIVDLTAVEKIEVTEKHMKKLAHLDMAAARSNPRIKIAVVASASDGIELNSYYEKYTEGKSPWVTRVFATRSEAEAWVAAES